jgi:uncharacterized protein YjiS (DUF1127 family)
MLYRDNLLGRAGVWARFAARLALWRNTRRQADLDLLAMNPHLLRDIGLDPNSIFRK